MKFSHLSEVIYHFSVRLSVFLRALRSEFLEATTCSFLSEDVEVSSAFVMGGLLLGFKLEAHLFSILNFLGGNSADLIGHLLVVERDSFEVLRDELCTAFKGSGLLTVGVVFGIDIQSGHLLELHDSLVVISKTLMYFSGDFLTADFSSFEFALDLGGINLLLKGFGFSASISNFLVVVCYALDGFSSHLHATDLSGGEFVVDLAVINLLNVMVLAFINFLVVCSYTFNGLGSHLQAELFSCS